MDYFRLLLLPFSILYGLVTWLRNRCYDWRWIKSTSFDRPTIVVGNLAVGGTGKSPMIEYLIRLLDGQYKLATLSRGYGRRTQGFMEVQVESTAAESGDEPLQFKRKFPHVTVAVGEDRVKGVRQLFETGHDVVLLDDAFQHRALDPGFVILLFEYHAMGRPRLLLPAGNYRDGLWERRRADLLVITKTPDDAAAAEKEQIRRRLSGSENIPVLFTGISYGTLVPVFPTNRNAALLDASLSILLVTGIANPTPLLRYLSAQVAEVEQLRYPDHHEYTSTDLRRIINRFNGLSNPRKLIVTTEKDTQRFLLPSLRGLLTGLPLYVMPIRVSFDHKEEQTFQQMVLAYCEAQLAPR
ncbi:tetraacyldisaccharide 4'-kinase [Parapedobacter deserti]|uniref:Tetraacyldisaccharide 4'-kinase n=1 Tax=Parapedobacter deserti TaxID=1912957 RepID=A0ABV7JQB4_9SPHI